MNSIKKSFYALSLSALLLQPLSVNQALAAENDSEVQISDYVKDNLNYKNPLKLFLISEKYDEASNSLERYYENTEGAEIYQSIEIPEKFADQIQKSSDKELAAKKNLYVFYSVFNMTGQIDVLKGKFSEDAGFIEVIPSSDNVENFEKENASAEQFAADNVEQFEGKSKKELMKMFDVQDYQIDNIYKFFNETFVTQEDFGNENIAETEKEIDDKKVNKKEQKDDEESNSTVWIFGGIGVVLLALLALFVFRRRG